MAKPINKELESPKVDADWEGDDPEDLEDGTDIADLGDTDDQSKDDAEGADSEAVPAEGEAKALDELEAEELEMLTEDEEAESLPVDEAEELRQIRRAAMSLESSADTAGAGEFVCSSCFLVKSGSQLADKRKKLCRDCA